MPRRGRRRVAAPASAAGRACRGRRSSPPHRRGPGVAALGAHEAARGRGARRRSCVPAAAERVRLARGRSPHRLPAPRTAATPPRPPRSACSARPPPRSSSSSSVARARVPTRGRLEAFSQGDGASFVPSRPFAEGETVSVSARLRLGAGGRPGPGVVELHGRQPGTCRARAWAAPPPSSEAASHQSFVSRPELRPPVVTVSSTRRPGHRRPVPGPLRRDRAVRADDPRSEHGRLIWFDPLPSGARASDLRVQSYRGQPVLTWWQDPLVAGGSSTAGGVIDNSSYRQIAVVRAGNGYQSDLHEFQLTAEQHGPGDRLRRGSLRPQRDRRPRESAVADTLFQEIDLATGLVRYEWHFLDHVPLSSSYYSGHTATAGLALRRLPHQLRGRGPRRQLPGGRPQHLGRLRRRSPQRPGALAARGQAQHLQARPRRRPPPGSTTPANSPTGRSPSSTTAPPPASTRPRGRSKSRSTPPTGRRRWCAPIRTPRRWWPTARATCRRSPTGTG